MSGKYDVQRRDDGKADESGQGEGGVNNPGNFADVI